MRPSTDRARRSLSTAASVALLAGVGCHHHHNNVDRYDDDPRGVQVVSPPPPDVAKPLPSHEDPSVPPSARHRLAEEPRYVAAYYKIGRPKVVVFVNRTLDGELLPFNPNSTPRNGLAPYDDRAVTYLHPGQYDQAQARSIDYHLIEDRLTENLSADGKVRLVSPRFVRQQLTDDQVRSIQAGQPQMLGELAIKLNADVLVQVTAHPSVQTDAGLGVRLVAEALDTHGGQALAFATVDVPAPLSRDQLDKFVGFASAKLMDGMSGAWEAMATPAGAAAPPPPVVTPVAPTPPEPPPVVAQPTVPQLPTTTPPAPAQPDATTPSPPPTLPTPAVPIPAVPPSTKPANPLDLPPP